MSYEVHPEGTHEDLPRLLPCLWGIDALCFTTRGFSAALPKAWQVEWCVFC